MMGEATEQQGKAVLGLGYVYTTSCHAVLRLSLSVPYVLDSELTVHTGSPVMGQGDLAFLSEDLMWFCFVMLILLLPTIEGRRIAFLKNLANPHPFNLVHV